MPSIKQAISAAYLTRGDRLVVLQPVELTGMKVAGGCRRLDDHFDDGRRQPHDILDTRA
jgi:hypothetical protein